MQRDDEFAQEQEEAAAREARDIGGTAGDEDIDPAQRPLVEGGEGEAEGFEVAEQDLVEHAEHTAGEGAPRLEHLTEVEEEPDLAAYGEADEEEPRDR